jgi:hypothetical protein
MISMSCDDVLLNINLLDGIYDDISESGGITWLYHDDPVYKFDTVTLQGNAHVAILSNTSSQDIEIIVTDLMGDTTGVLHTGRRQRFRFTLDHHDITMLYHQIH